MKRTVWRTLFARFAPLSQNHPRRDVGRVADLIFHSRHLVVLTGAGVSTPSGIPDFRSPKSGLWEQADPFEVASFDTFTRRPDVFYDWARPLVQLMRTARPNPAHLALAQLEQMGYLKALITQNIDRLHQAAGSQCVLEVHGSMQQATCLRCYNQVETAPYLDRFLERGEIPRCPACGGILKPDVILFGEMLPVQTLYQAQQAASRCDLFMVVGSSLEVAPAGDLPFLALQRGVPLIILGDSRTPLDGQATVVVRDNVAISLPAIVTVLKERAGDV